jgi:alpha-glucosidase
MRPFARDLAIRGENREVVDDSWTTVWGKRRQVRNHANELTLSVEETVLPRCTIGFIVHAFNDGAAFRYRIPEQPGVREFRLAGEQSEFRNKTLRELRATPS